MPVVLLTVVGIYRAHVSERVTHEAVDDTYPSQEDPDTKAQ